MVGRIYQLPIIVDYDKECRGQLYFYAKISAELEVYKNYKIKLEGVCMKYDVIIIGAGPGGIFSAYELTKQAPELKVAVFEAGHELRRRKCPIDGTKIKSCVGCESCSIMSGFGGAGAFSDGKLSLSPDVGGNLPEILG